jgi:membrane-associated phospholipid phosphatase
MAHLFRCGVPAILMILPHSLLAQSPSSGKFSADASHVVGGTAHVLTSPARWRGKDWAIFGSVLAGTFALSYLDEPFDDFLQRHRSGLADNLADFGNTAGEPLTAIALTGGLYAAGLIADSEWLRESCVIISASLLPGGMIQSTVKYVASRARPHVGLGHDEFVPFRGGEVYYSFFSGHTMIVTTISYTFATRLEHPAAKITLCGLATVGAFARTYGRAHWLTDVAIGNAMAIASVHSVSKWLAAKKEKKEMGGLQWQITPSGRGLNLSVAW